MNIAKTLALAGYLSATVGLSFAFAAVDHTISQKGKVFSEKKLELSVGQTVNFINDDAVKHNIIVKKLKFNGGISEPGQETQITFDKSGKFKVRCGIHPKMKMTVKVN